MINEKKLDEIRHWNFETWTVAGATPGEVVKTLEALWKVARAARRWTNASPGKDSALAESELVKSLDDLREEAEP